MVGRSPWSKIGPFMLVANIVIKVWILGVYNIAAESRQSLLGKC